jgi:uncharacterized SAM-binding protein YcdF (DUF218 family)
MQLSFARSRHQIAAAANAIIVICALLVYDWNPLIDVAGQFLIDPDAPAKSDIIYLLGGDYLARAPLAASLEKSGFAPMILIAREPSKLTDATIGLLTAMGVPRSGITDILVGHGVTSTADEARALRLYVRAHKVRSVLVVTSMLHSRRAGMAMRRALWGTGVQVRVVCVGDAAYASKEQGQAKLEWAKLIYYSLTFWG